jgi:hypothetical protein
MSENMESIPNEVVNDIAAIDKPVDKWGSIYWCLGGIAFVII